MIGNKKIINATTLIVEIGIANFADFIPTKKNASMSNIGMYGKLVIPTVTFHKNELGAGKIISKERNKKKIEIINLIIFQYTICCGKIFFNKKTLNKPLSFFSV